MAKRGGEFYDKDSGYQALMTTFQGKGEEAVFVGFLRSSGVYQPKQGGAGKPMTMAQLGAIHEFGAPNAGIPERSFMRSAVEANKHKLEKLVERLAGQVIDGKLARRNALGILGEYVKNLFKAMIRKGLKPPLKPATVRRKGSSKPLIDTGQLINSIDWEVVENKKERDQ